MPTIYPNGSSPLTIVSPQFTAKDLLHPIRWLRQIGPLLAFWAAWAQQRRALSRLDARLLRDIGVNHYDAKREAEKPFWRD